MKRIVKFMSMAFLVAISSMALFSCSEEGDNLPKKHNLKIILNLEEGATIDQYSDLVVALTNEKGEEQNLELKAQETEVEVLQGQYNLVLSGKVSDAASTYVSGKASVDVYADASVTIDAVINKKSQIIFKSIFVSSGKQAYFSDSYFELVNNSDEIAYLDQMILAAPMYNKDQNEWQAAGILDKYECGQGVVIAFPGTGKEYPLRPGESVVIANNPIDHSLAAGEGNKCPNLKDAKWDIYIENVKGEIDYPAPNMDIIFQNNTFFKCFAQGVFGRHYLLARIPNMTAKEFAAQKENIMTPPNTAKTIEYLVMPSKYVLDAVQTWDKGNSKHCSGFLPQDDAQGVFAADAWSGLCVRRKVTKIENGRAYYQDTNNSSKDFLTNQPLTPGQDPTEVDK